MRSVLTLVCCVVATLGVVVPTLAQAPDVYRVEVSVPNQSESERIAAAKAAMPDVLVKSTTNPDLLSQPQVKQAIQDANSYVSHFSYSADNRLVLNFSPQAIRNLLQQGQANQTAVSIATITLAVTKVESLADMKQLQMTLKNQPNIRKAELTEVKGDRVLYTLMLNATPELTRASLVASAKLNCTTDVAAGFDCRWVR